MGRKSMFIIASLLRPYVYEYISIQTVLHDILSICHEAIPYIHIVLVIFTNYIFHAHELFMLTEEHSIRVLTH